MKHPKPEMIKYNDKIDTEVTAKAKLRAIMNTHSIGPLTHKCTECLQDYPCETVLIILPEW